MINKPEYLLEIIQILESKSIELEYPVEIYHDGKIGWHISGKPDHFIGNLLDIEWKDKAKLNGVEEMEVEGVISFSANVTPGSPGSYHQPPEGPEADIEDVTLHVENHDPIDINHEIDSWSDIKDKIEELALDKASDYDDYDGPDRLDHEDR